MTPSRFRYLLWFYLVVFLADLALAVIIPTAYSPELERELERVRPAWFNEDSLIVWALIAVFFSAMVAELVGLYRFQPWGRTLSLWFTLIAFLFYPLVGPSLYSPLEGILYELSVLLWGAILALSYYCQPISDRFSLAAKSPHEQSVKTKWN